MDRLDALLEKVNLLFDIEAAMQQAIQRGASGAEITGIVARKKAK